MVAPLDEEGDHGEEQRDAGADSNGGARPAGARGERHIHVGEGFIGGGDAGFVGRGVKEVGREAVLPRAGRRAAGELAKAAREGDSLERDREGAEIRRGGARDAAEVRVGEGGAGNALGYGDCDEERGWQFRWRERTSGVPGNPMGSSPQKGSL